MTRSVKWRLIIIGIVLVFALFNLYPTLRWASLSESRRVELTARWDKQATELREDLKWDRLSPEGKLADVGDMIAPLQEAQAGEELDEVFWQRVKDPNLAELSEEEKEDFFSLCDRLTGNKIARDATTDQLSTLLAPLRRVGKDNKFWKWVEIPKWESLKKKEQEKYRDIILQLTGKRVPRNASVARNIKNWLVRWWQGDESQIISLGLDLKGGSYFVLEVEEARGVSAADAMKGAIGVLNERINRTGVREPIIQQQGGNKIIIQLPGMTNVERQRVLIERQASMRWMLVDEDRMKLSQFSEERLLNLYDNSSKELQAEFADKRDERGNRVDWTFSDLDERLKDSLPPDTVLRVLEREERVSGKKVPRRSPLLLQSSEDRPEIIKGDELTGAMATRDSDTGEPVINFTLNRDGAKKFSEVTREYNSESKNAIRESGGRRGWRLAILLDEEVISAPAIRSEIYDRGQITGDFTPEEARDLSIQLKAGALPAKLNIVAQRSIGPTLGADSVRKGVFAAILGLILVAAFMMVYYFFAGAIADFALTFNIVIILGVLASLRATLTLPGIAGIILTIGMAVDANVLIFERIREEQAAAKKIGAAIDSGYQKAFRTILDANVTTFITALVLYYIGSGPVRGFAVTLMIGLATSMFTAIVVTRVVFDILLRFKRFQRLPMMAFVREPKFDFITWRNKAFIISIAFIAAGMISFGAKWSRNFGIDFSSGTTNTLVFQNEVTPADLGKIRASLKADTTIEDFNLRRFRLQGEEKDTGVVIDAKLRGGADASTLTEKVGNLLPSNPVVNKSEETVFPTVANRLWKQALMAVAVSMLGIIIYVSWRFEFRFALGAILALIHDVLVTLGLLTGLFILARRQLNLPVVAAVLTIIGYSVNDTIVVFDRIREDLKIMKGVDLKTIINTSINQTLSRTLLTSMTTLLVVICLFLFGGQAINDFAFALLVGVIAGTYSTIFVASPIVFLLERKK